MSKYTRLQNNIRLEKVKKKIEECQQHFEGSQMKAAVQSCDEALSEDKENKKAVGLRAKIISELKRTLKTIYEDSFLEENLGNVDAAKEKWKKIIDEDVRDGEYYRKAKEKLKHYGIEIQ